MNILYLCFFIAGVMIFVLFWVLSGSDEETVTCGYCHRSVNGNQRVCPHCKRALSYYMIGCISGIFLMFLSAVLLIYDYSNTKHIMTSGTYALYDRTYCFKIDDMDYDGDTYESGYYTFDLYLPDIYRATPMMYDIYVSYDYFTNNVQVLNYAEHKTIVGGLGNYPQSFSLNPNQYVYCVPYRQLLYEPHGTLRIRKN